MLWHFSCEKSSFIWAIFGMLSYSLWERGNEMLNTLRYEVDCMLFETIDILSPHEEGQDNCEYHLKSEMGVKLNVRGVGRDGEWDVCIRGPGALVYIPHGPHYNEEALWVNIIESLSQPATGGNSKPILDNMLLLSHCLRHNSSELHFLSCYFTELVHFWSLCLDVWMEKKVMIGGVQANGQWSRPMSSWHFQSVWYFLTTRSNFQLIAPPPN